MNWMPPILIYQMGKVGSKSIRASLDAIGLANVHVHFLSWLSLSEVENYYKGLPHAGIPTHISHGKEIRTFIDETWGKTRWKVITLVREPVARAISDVFENISFSMPHLNRLNEDDAFKTITDYTLEQIHNFDEKTDYVCNWFDKEIKEVFKFDIYASPFNRLVGYQIYETDKADILFLKLEKLSDCHQLAFDDFLGVQNFELKKANVGKLKPYRHMYSRVLANISIPEPCLDTVYASRFSQKFFTNDEIKKFKSKWLNQTFTGSGSDLKHVGSKISPIINSPLNVKNEETKINIPDSGRLNRKRLYKSAQIARRHALPKISLVTPSYNQAQYLEECIDSVLSQKYPNLEYIIMDGGSTDNSVEIIKKYQKHLTYWQSRPDGGQYAAISEGFRKTSGEIMSWLNSDDKFHSNAFLIVAAVFMNRQDIEWITGRSNTFNDKGEQS